MRTKSQDRRRDKVAAVSEEHCLGLSDIDILRVSRETGSYLFLVDWGSGNQLSLGPFSEVEATVGDMMNRNYDDSYDLRVYNLKTCKEVTWETEITVKVIEE